MSRLSRRFLTEHLAAIASVFVAGALPLYAQQPTPDQTSFVEVNWMKVRQDRVAEFADLARRIADANRRGKGDNWVAYADFYGTDQYVSMAAMRSSLDQIEPGMNSFMRSVKEMMGYTPERLFSEGARVMESSGTELRRRRWDLSWGVKGDQDWISLMAKAAYLAVITIRVKPGKVLEAEKQFMMIKQAAGNNEGRYGAVTQVVLGGSPGTFYITIPMESLIDIGKMAGGSRSILGEEGYRTYSQMSAEDYASVDYRLARAVPMWSSPPASYLESNPKFWTVKPAASAKQKPAASDNKAAGTGSQ